MRILVCGAGSVGHHAAQVLARHPYREMARGFPTGHGLEPKAWEDHVVDMAGQMLAIGKKDPKVFQSYENFVVGLRGPQ